MPPSPPSGLSGARAADLAEVCREALCLNPRAPPGRSHAGMSDRACGSPPSVPCWRTFRLSTAASATPRPKIPLGELVAHVAGETHVALSASAEVADEPVALAVGNVPARELLDRLAVLLGYQWTRNAGTAPAASPTNAAGYEIGQDAADKAREESLRQAACADVERRFEEEVRHYVEAAALTAEQVAASQRDVQRRRKQLEKLTPAQRAALFQSPQEWERIRRAAIVGRMTSPLIRTLASLLGRLTPAQWTSLRSDGAVDFSSEPGTGEYALPADLAAAFRANPPKAPARPLPAAVGAGASSGAPAPRAARPATPAPMSAWAAAPGYRVAVRMDRGGLAGTGGMALLLRVSPLGPRPTPAGSRPGAAGRSACCWKWMPRTRARRDRIHRGAPRRAGGRLTPGNGQTPSDLAPAARWTGRCWSRTLVGRGRIAAGPGPVLRGPIHRGRLLEQPDDTGRPPTAHDACHTSGISGTVRRGQPYMGMRRQVDQLAQSHMDLRPSARAAPAPHTCLEGGHGRPGRPPAGRLHPVGGPVDDGPAPDPRPGDRAARRPARICWRCRLPARSCSSTPACQGPSGRASSRGSRWPSRR